MVDRRLRELERKAAAGDHASRVRLLSHRIRYGMLPSWICDCAGDPVSELIAEQPEEVVVQLDDDGMPLLTFSATSEGTWDSDIVGAALDRLGEIDDRPSCPACHDRGEFDKFYRLRLAAFLGDEAAIETLSTLGQHGIEKFKSLSNLCRGIPEWGKVAALRASAEIARRCYEPWWRARTPLPDSRPETLAAQVGQQLESMDEWILCPCEDHRTLFFETHAAFYMNEPGGDFAYPAPGSGTRSGRIGFMPDYIETTSRLLRSPPRSMGRQRWNLARQARGAQTFLEIPDEDAIQLIVNALLPWALGDRDPVAERVARQARVHGRE